MTVYRELLEIAIEHHGGDAMKARADVKECMDKTKETLTDAEREFFYEKSGAFLGDGYNTEEADAEALDMIIKKRPDRSAAGAEMPPPALKAREGLEALGYMGGRGIPLIGAYASGAMIGKQEPENFTTDRAEIAALMAGEGNRRGRAKGTIIQRFYFIPQAAGLLCLDIDRKPGKSDGLKELYKLFPKDTLPRALQDIERYFPCYVKTPSGGYHLYFKYAGETVRKTDLCPEVEVKHGKPGLTAPGSRKENGEYILYGDIENAPPLYGIIIDRIKGLQKQKPPESRAAADRPARIEKPRITLEALAQEVGAVPSHAVHGKQV